jgi:hypothetical protein
MKKLRNLCIAIIALTGLSFSANAQNGTSPNVGSTHTYSVVNNTDNTYAWFVTANFGDLADATTSVATLSSTTGNSIDITWATAVLGETYFVHVVETVTATTCSNHKVLAVTPANGFNLAIAAVDDGDVLLTGDGLEDCAPDVTVTGYTVGTQTFVYYYGENEFYYRITAVGIGADGWSPQFNIDKTDSESTVTAAWSTTYNGTYASVTDVSGVYDIDVAGNTPSVWVKVTVANAEGLAANPIKMTLLDGVNTSEDEFGNDVNTITGKLSTQTVKLRPTVVGITTDL